VVEEVFGVEGLCSGFEGGAGGGRADDVVEVLAMGTVVHGMMGVFPLDMGGEGR
jgi:hypothetical protein